MGEEDINKISPVSGEQYGPFGVVTFQTSGASSSTTSESTSSPLSRNAPTREETTSTTSGVSVTTTRPAVRRVVVPAASSGLDIAPEPDEPLPPLSEEPVFDESPPQYDPDDPQTWTDEELAQEEDFNAGLGSGDRNFSPNRPSGVDQEAVERIKRGTRTEFETYASNGAIEIDIYEVGYAAGLSYNDITILQTAVTGSEAKNLMAAWVYLLLNGAAAAGKTVQAKGNNNLREQPITIEGNMLMYMWHRGNSIVNGKFDTAVENAFKKTVAYNDGFFNDIGEIGEALVSSTDNLPSNPLTGSKKQTPSLLEKALNKIHPKFTEELEKYINVLKGKAYLALPAGVLGSIQYAINYITGVIAYIAQMINEIYQGVLKLIQEVIAAIDSIMGIIMQWLLTLIDQIIPLEIICFILDILSIFVGNMTFITNLFSSSAKISDVLETFGVMPEISLFLSNPVGLLTSFLPGEVSEIMSIVNSVANDPLGYLGSVLSDYGYGYMAYYLQGDIMGGILNQFGSQAPVLYPLAAVFRKYGITGQVQLFDPDAPSRNVVLPEFLTSFRGDYQRFFDSMGRDIVKRRNQINEGVYDAARAISPSPDTFGIPSNNFGIDSGTTGT